MEDREHIIQKVEQMSKRMRKNALDMALAAGANSSHFGSGLSIIEITATLYGASFGSNFIITLLSSS